MDELEARIAELQALEELAAIRPDLDGNQVMARLGLKPGRAVGEALSFLLELRLEEGPLGPEEAGPRLDAWWAAQAAEEQAAGEQAAGEQAAGEQAPGQQATGSQVPGA
jgi:poly(A) polymerase